MACTAMQSLLGSRAGLGGAVANRCSPCRRGQIKLGPDVRSSASRPLQAIWCDVINTRPGVLLFFVAPYGRSILGVYDQQADNVDVVLDRAASAVQKKVQ